MNLVDHVTKTKYTLDSEAIMKVVNCSSATYRRATEEIRRELTDDRDFAVKRLNYEGISQREIQQRTGVPQKTISRILSESKRSVSKTTQDEYRNGLSEEKRHDGIIPQSVNTLQDLSESNRSVSKMTHGETLDGHGEEKAHNAEIPQSENEQSDQKRHSAKNGHSSNEQIQSADKRHDAKTPQDRIQKRKAKLIESITRQLKALSVQQLKSVDDHIGTVSDF